MGFRLLLCVLSFGVEQDFLLNFIDGGIACKNIWLCHVPYVPMNQAFMGAQNNLSSPMHIMHTNKHTHLQTHTHIHAYFADSPTQLVSQ